MAALAALPAAPFGTVAGLREINAVLDRCDTQDVSGAESARQALGALDRTIRRLQSVRLAVLAEADRSEVAGLTGASGTAAWVAAETRTDGAAAGRDVRLATALDDGLPATREALAAGDVSSEHAQVIASATGRLPAGLSAAERAAIESSLVQRAKLVDPAALRKSARRALEAADRSQAEVDAHEDRVLRDKEQEALARTRLTWHHHTDGTTTGSFTVPTLAASILVKTIQQMASPRRFARRVTRDVKQSAAAAGRKLTAAELREASWDAQRSSDVDWAHRYGTAFVELLEHLPTDKLTGKVAATVVVTVEHGRLKDELGSAHLDTGQDLSASEARRLACGAGLLPAVLAGPSQLLDLGRTDRFFTEAQRVALATRYDTCVAAGCDRPYSWTELHHEDPWHTGGHTDLDLAVPLCGHHHRRIHDRQYFHRLETDATGRKSVMFTRRT